MNNSTVNFTTESSTNSTSLRLVDCLEISVYCLHLLFGFPIHSYVLWLIFTGSSGVASDFINFSLSVCELANIANNFIFVLSICFDGLSEFDIFLVGFAITGRPLFQCLMCVERYLAVVHPVTFLKLKPLRYRVICCATAWIITLGSCVFCLFYLVSHITYICTWLLSFQMIFFLSIELFCLVAVLSVLKQSGPGERKREKEENYIKRRAFQIILITTVNTVFMYVPKAITGFYEIKSRDETKTNMFPAFTFFILTGYVHPVLYLQRSGKFPCSCMS